MDCSPPCSSLHRDSAGKNTGVDCHALLQGIFLTQESNRDLLHWRWILDQLSYQGSPTTMTVNVLLFKKSMYQLLNCGIAFQRLYHFSSTSAVNELLFFHILTSTGIVSVLDFVHFNRCAVLSHCFTLQFPDDTWYWASFQYAYFHLYVFFGKMSLQIDCPFCNWVVEQPIYF